MKKMTLSIAILVLITFAFWMINRPNNQSAGTITIQVIDVSANIVVNDHHAFNEGDSLFDILNQHYNLICANALYRPDASCDAQHWGRVILSIDDVHTDWNTTFLHLTVNGEHSHLGVDSVRIKDKDIIQFTVQKPN